MSHAAHRLLTGSPPPLLDSYRYPRDVSSTAELRLEMLAAQHSHGRLGVCAWRLAWQPGRPVVRWDDAWRLVA